MGNYVSSCTFMIAPVMKSNKAARVIFPSGEVRQFRESIKAAEIMLDCPGFFVVNSRTLNINRCFSSLSADEDLEPGNIYIMFPMRRVNSMVTPADMAVFWMAGKQISGGGGSGGEVKVVEQPRLVVEGPEFSYRLAVCRSLLPFVVTVENQHRCLISSCIFFAYGNYCSAI
ncbi:hypothetical protein L1987_57493 [Smallanthus sonchifolius]|uniref:Uncharacterized protein n=1 Tax=Smallanthus sonchifolius TaxID=185202 RepID=A0ACB9DCQ0_9ASTR|nr:hypothetical protein L1987_57493 [Smallanthus sonchifolius]